MSCSILFKSVITAFICYLTHKHMIFCFIVRIIIIYDDRCTPRR
eukprot:UN09861